MPVEKCTECSMFFHAETLVDGACPPCARARLLKDIPTVDLLEVIARRGSEVLFYRDRLDGSEELPIVTVDYDVEPGRYRYWIGNGFEDELGDLVEREAVEDFLQ